MTHYNRLLWWQTEGNQIVCYDHNGIRHQIRIRGTNIIGFETGFFCFCDMWEKDPHNHASGGGMTFDDILNRVQELGYNALRVPVTAVFLLEKLNQRVEHLGSQNWELQGKTYGELIHILLAKCCERNIMVLLDFHKCETGEIEEMFSQNYPESKVMECHRILCYQYANNYNCVFGIELKNEPHIKDVSSWEKSYSTGAHWDTGPEHLRWKNVAQRLGNEVLRISPHIIVVVDGISFHTPWESTQNYSWWGSHFKQCKDFNSFFWLDKPNKYACSIHPYGPSVAPSKPQFYEPNYPWNMIDYLDNVGFYLHKENHCPLLITEWGGKTNDHKDTEYQYMLANYMNELGIGNFHWSFNRFSADTSSVLELDKNTGDYYYDWNRFDITKKSCLNPTYLNFKQMTNVTVAPNGVASRSISIPIEMPIQEDNCDFFLPMQYGATKNGITINDKKINLCGITWYGFEKEVGKLDGCENFSEVRNRIHVFREIEVNYIRLPISLVPFISRDDIYINRLQNVVKTLMNNGILVGITIHNFECGSNPPQLWYNDTYKEVQVTQGLQNLVQSLSHYPNFMSIEIKDRPQSDFCKWGNGDLTNDFVLANERIGNQILSNNLLLFVNNTKGTTGTTNLKQKLSSELVYLNRQNGIVYLDNVEQYPSEQVYKEGKISELLDSVYRSEVIQTVPLVVNISVKFATQYEIDSVYSYMKWFRQNDISVILDDAQFVFQNIQQRMAQDFFMYSTKLCFRKKASDRQRGRNKSEDINRKQKRIQRNFQTRLIVLPDLKQVQNREIVTNGETDKEWMVTPMSKNYPNETLLTQQIQQNVTTRDFFFTVPELEDQLHIKQKVLQNWVDGKGVNHQLIEVILKNQTQQNIKDFTLYMKPSERVKQIWEIDHIEDEQNNRYILHIPTYMNDNTKFKPNSLCKFGYITQNGQPDIIIDEIEFEE